MQFTRMKQNAWQNVTERLGCAAPEQYTGDVLDGRTDIYAIGAVLHYMLTGHFPGEPVRPEQVKLSGITERRLMRLIRKCLQKEKDRRFQTAEELEQALQKLWEQSENGVFQYGAKCMEESLVIAVAGSRHGVGTTHIAMGLAAYLQKCGMSAVYEEFNESGAVRQLAECRGARADSCGVFRIWKTPMLPCYGEAVEWKPSGYRIRILDCGADPGLLSAGKRRRIPAYMRRKTMGMGKFRRSGRVMCICAWTERHL